jgi:serine/threonine-protein kinase
VADFGIALAVSRIEGGSRMTETGMSLGTPHYMSPEQAMGDRSVDARTDVYALGCVLYEMLTGEPPFTGPTAQAIVARVLTDAPRSVRAQRHTIPEHVDAAVRKALEKLPADRFGTASEFAAALTDSSFRTAATPVAGAATVKRTSRAGMIAATAAILTLGIVAAWGWFRPQDRPTVWTYVSHPAGEEGTFQFGSFALAPDGQSYVYIGPGEGGTSQLWLKRRTELHAVPLRGTTGAVGPFFSPDGAWLAFFAGGKLLKMPASGGTTTVVANATVTAQWGAWLPNNKIILGGPSFDLLEVDESGAAPRTLTVLTTFSHGAVGPVPLPGTRGDFIFAACTVNCGSRQIWVFDGAAGQGRMLLDNAFPLFYAEGHLLYGIDNTMFAAPFDLDRLELKAPGVPVLENSIMASLSKTGTLMYAEGSFLGREGVEWVSRDGVATPVDSAWSGNFSHVSISPDGKWIAVDHSEPEEQSIWVYPVSGGAPSRVTFSGKINMRPVWSPDGSRVAWVTIVDSVATINVKRADGIGTTSKLIATSTSWEAEWSPDAQWIVYRGSGRQDPDDIYAVRVQGDTTPVPIATTKHYERGATVSPDGRYVAYVSSESGKDEIYVRPFPNAESGRWVVSSGGGLEPRWSRNSQELFYVSPDEVLYSVAVTLGDRFTHQVPRRLFSVSEYHREPNSRAYDVAPDGRFVMLRGTALTGGAPVLVENWLAELKRRLKK